MSPDYAVVTVATLPWPHNPYKCGLFRELEREVADFRSLDAGDAQGAFGRFISTRDEADLRRCPYHDVDWGAAAEIAVEVFEAGHIPERAWQVEALAPATPEELLFPVATFFGADAIAWDRTSGFLSNGQHRVCPLKTGSAERCVVRVLGDWPSPPPRPGRRSRLSALAEGNSADGFAERDT